MKLGPWILKGLGALYFLLHIGLLVFAATYVLMGLTVSACGVEGVLIVMIPLLGLSAGHFIRRGKFGFGRILLIALSVFLSSGLILMSFVLPAILGKPASAGTSSADLGVKLIEAVRNGQEDEVLRLLGQGVSVKARNEFGESVLHAVKDPAMAEFLIARGADVDAREDSSGMTPLFFQGLAVAKVLVDAGAGVNERSHKGNTPLIWHTYGNHPGGIQYLVSKGADINAVNDDGSTALDIAERFGERELADFLRSLGAKGAEEIAAEKKFSPKAA